MTSSKNYPFHARRHIPSPTEERQAAAVAAYRKRKAQAAMRKRVAIYATVALSIFAAVALFYAASN